MHRKLKNDRDCFVKFHTNKLENLNEIIFLGNRIYPNWLQKKIKNLNIDFHKGNRKVKLTIWAKIQKFTRMLY